MKYYKSIGTMTNSIWVKREDGNERCLYSTSKDVSTWVDWKVADGSVIPLDNNEYFIEITEEEAFLEMI